MVFVQVGGVTKPWGAQARNQEQERGSRNRHRNRNRTGTVDSRDPEAFVSTCPRSASHQIILLAVSIIAREGIHVFIAADLPSLASVSKSHSNDAIAEKAVTAATCKKRV